MAVLGLSQIYDHLPIEDGAFTIQRNDELSGIGSGVVFQSELAPPLWAANISLALMYAGQARSVSARLRSLDGALQPFLMCDPIADYPQGDPDGALIAGATVTVVSASGFSLSLTGLPAGYRLTVGDKIQITSSGKTSFVEVSQNVTANGAGNTGAFNVFPRLPSIVGSGNAVTLAKAACPCVMVPGSFKPGTASGNIVTGMSFSVVQKRGV